MFNISQFFEKFKNIEKSSSEKTSAVINTIKKFTKIELQKESLEIREETIRLKCSPVFKNEIFMKKELIEEDLKNQKIYLRIT